MASEAEVREAARRLRVHETEVRYSTVAEYAADVEIVLQALADAQAAVEAAEIEERLLVNHSHSLETYRTADLRWVVIHCWRLGGVVERAIGDTRLEALRALAAQLAPGEGGEAHG